MKRPITFLPALFVATLAMFATAAQAQTASTRTDIKMLKRTEKRVESLRSRLIELDIEEIRLRALVEDLDYRLRPDNIQRAIQFVGSPRSINDFREDVRKALDSDKARANQELELLNSERARIEPALHDSEAQCTRLRKKLGLEPETDNPTSIGGVSLPPL